MKIVFDFGAVLFHWHPPSFLARVWAHRVPDEIEGAEIAKHFFQAYSGDWGAFDQGLIDGLANGAGYASRAFGWVGSRLQTGQVNTYAFAVVAGTLLLLAFVIL